MKFGTLEFLALILISIVIIKTIVLIVNPNYWYQFVEKLYAKPRVISIASLLSAGLVLYLLVTSGVTVIEILAVSLFIMLLIVTGIAKYVDIIIAWSREQGIVFIVKELWLYTLVWLLLLAWGVGEILLG
jgi:hypothetical protein